jgi:hypothetical protein
MPASTKPNIQAIVSTPWNTLYIIWVCTKLTALIAPSKDALTKFSLICTWKTATCLSLRHMGRPLCLTTVPPGQLEKKKFRVKLVLHWSLNSPAWIP